MLGTTYDSEADAVANNELKKDMIVVLIFVIILSAFVYFIVRSIIAPLKELSAKATLISEGDLTVKVNITSTDEIGHLGKVFNIMLENLNHVVHQGLHSADCLRKSASLLTEST